MLNNQLKFLSLLSIIPILLFIFFKLNFNYNNLFFIGFVFFMLITLMFFYFSNLIIKKQIIIFLSTLYFLLFVIEFNFEKLFYSTCKSNECQRFEKNKIEKKLVKN